MAGKASILVIGPSFPFKPDLNLSKSRFSFKWNKLSDQQQAYQWLAGEKKTMPLMVFADYRTVAAGNFQWIRFFRSKRAFQFVPIILLNCPRQMDQRKALSVGIDDYYDCTPDWNYLITRGRQLQRVRGQLDRPLPRPRTPEGIINFWQLGKRFFDIFTASSLLLLFLPLCLIIAAAIKLESKGPVIYRSRRAGQYYRVFNFLKFRSMYVDADRRLAELQHLNQYSGSNGNTFVKIKNDPRVTKVGRIIRKTSLDELPQLLNVLRGDMSLVGNRPLPLYEASQLCKEDTAERFAAPAGITGLWQVTKRGKDEMSAEERIGLDIEYSRRSSFWFDMKIVFRTLPAMLQHENV